MKQLYPLSVLEHTTCSKFKFYFFSIILLLSSLSYGQSQDVITFPINGEKIGNPTVKKYITNTTNSYRMPPSNDSPCSATPILMNTCVSSTTVSATQTLTGCAGNADDDVWFSFLAPATDVNISVTDGSLNDSVFELFSGTCGSLTSIGCIDGSFTNEFATATLTAGNTYFLRVYSFGGSGNQGTFDICVNTYCIPTSGNSSTRHIDNFTTTSGITNINNNSGRGTTVDGYSDFTSISTSQNTGGILNFSTSYNDGNYGLVIWVDWNNDGDFTDAGEKMYGSTSRASSHTGSFTISGTVGTYRLRIRADRGIDNTNSLDSCGYNNNTEAEDYTLIVTAGSPCIQPTSQATSLTFGAVTSTTIAGSFTTASPAPTNYLILRNTTGTTPSPTPTDGTAYAIGATVGGAIVVDNDANNTFTATGLSPTTTYYFFIYSFNSGCTGAPDYLTLTPATGNETTISGPLLVPSSGNNVYTTCSGNLYDNGGSAGNYANSSNGYTVLNPTGVGNYIEVSGSISAEGGYDYLTIYDGVGLGGTVLWGGSVHGSGTSCSTFTVPTITSITGSLTVQFYSDGSNNCAGFNLSIACTTTPGSITYCTPSVDTNAHAARSYIRRIDFVGTLNNTTNTSTYSTSPRGYQDFTGLTDISQQAQGEGVNVYNEYEITVNPVHVKAWVDWNKDGDFDDTGESVYDTGNQAILSSTFGFVIPAAQTPGYYRLRIRAGESTGGFAFGPCGQTTYYGETEDYLFEVVTKCTNVITDVTDGVACGTSQNVLLEFEGSSGITGFNIYANETGGTPLTTPAPPTFTAGANPTGTWTTPAISTTTSYWVTAINGCESQKRTEVIANIKPIPTLSFTPNTPILCGEDHIVEIYAYGDKETVYLIDEDFEGSGLGVFTQNQYSSSTITSSPSFSNTAWTQRTSTHVPAELVWFPAIASDFGTNKFVMTNSDINANDGTNPIPFQNELRSATVNSTDYLNLTLKFDMYYSDYYEADTSGSPTGDYVSVRVSTDGGSNWITERLDYNADVGVGTKFDRINIDLSAYINEPNLVISFYYHSNYWSDGVALDNIQLFGEKPLSTDFDWVIDADAYIDAAATIPYISGTSAPISTIYVKPTPAQLENNLFTFTATAILVNGCSASTDITIANNTKYFIGPDNSYIDWNVATNWKPAGVPTNQNCVIVPNTYTSVIDGTTDGEALNVTVKNGGTLNIKPNGTLTIVNFSDVKSGGTFIIEDDASLIQIDDVTNTGTGDVKRNSEDVRDTDYIYWSSPVDSYDLSGISPGIPYYYRWQWVPTVGTNTNGFGDWTYASGNMTIGKGYIVRAGTSNSDSTADTPVNTTFSGVFNNGNISMPISSGSYDGADYSGPSSTTVTKNDDNWNLIGNPYPSAIDAIDFLNANTNIEGAVHIWTHGTQINTTNAPPFYEDYVYSYNINDYTTYNASGASSGAGTYGGSIASGQGFFVMMNHGAADTDVNFNNTMRHKSYDNGEFYRTHQAEDSNSIERHRIWLSIISPTNQTATSLVGYIEGATLEKDRLFDAYGIENNAMNLFSLIEDERMLIQGRPIPFNTEDQVPIGAVIPVAGNYTIAIHSVDGLFEDETQDIYLEDLELNIIHNLREQPYSFNAESGVFENRFVLRYTNSLLSIEQHNEIDDLSITAPKNNYIKVTSAKDAIKNIEIYDLLGRVIFENKNILKSEVVINDLNTASGALVVKVTLANGLQKTQKLILK